MVKRLFFQRLYEYVALPSHAHGFGWKQEAVVVKPPEWKFITIIARNTEF